MNTFYNEILKAKASGRKLFAVLIDPEKCDEPKLEQYATAVNRYRPDFVLVGGSQMQCSVERAVLFLKQCVQVPIVLFPGNALQLTAEADAVLLLSLISGRNAEFLIGQHVKAARALRDSGIEIVPTGYILIDGGNVTAVAQVSATQPIAANKTEYIVATALAGEQLGLRLIYLEAGSGAQQCVEYRTIAAVRQELSVPLIVGGGIKTREQKQAAFDAGADIVVVGNALEADPMRLGEMV